MPQTDNITVCIWSIAETTIHLESKPFQYYQKPETFMFVVFDFEDESVSYVKIMKLTKKMIKKV